MWTRPSLLIASALSICSFAWAADTANVTVLGSSPPSAFAASEIRAALQQAGWTIQESADQARLHIALSAPDGRGDPESFEITTTPTGSAVNVHVRGRDARGVMYGGLDVAEQIALSPGPVQIVPRQGQPFLPVRGLKFNIPLAGNAYLSAEDQAHGDWFWDVEYWQSFIRFLAYHRYNLLSFWNSHPYDQIVRIEKYPEATGLPKEKLDANIAFFHKLLGMARDRGIDTSIVTWNIHTSAAFQKAHNVKDAQDSELIRDYQKECVKALFREYPELTGMGTCPGEAMPGTADWREEWIRQTYLLGISESGRTQMPFILRYWGGTPAATQNMLEKAKYAGPMYLDIKFNGEHMYSSPQVHLKEQGWLTQKPRDYQLLWHLRNDCIYQLRWADPDFAAAMIRNCGGPGSAGFVMGSEIEVPGLDRNHTPQAAVHKSWKYEFEKNWTRFGMWGRAGYNPNESHDYWIACFSRRFGPQAGPAAFEALCAASKIIPLTTSFHWNYMNGDWYPEGNVGDWNTSAEMLFANYRDKNLWHDVLEWTFNHVIDDSLQCIPDYVADQLTGVTANADVITPPRYAEQLEAFASACAQARQQAAAHITTGQGEWACTEADLKALELLGRYYAAKSRAATETMFFLAKGEEKRRDAAIDQLNKALDLWKQLAKVTDHHYIAHEIWLFGKQFDWSRYRPEAERDIQLVRELTPWPRSEQKWNFGRVAIPVPAWQFQARSPAGMKEWIEAFNQRVAANTAHLKALAALNVSTVPVATDLSFSEAGTGVISLRSSRIVSARINGRPARIAGAPPEPSLIGDVQIGTNHIELTLADKISLPLITDHQVAGTQAIFIEAESGLLMPPFEAIAMPGVSGGKIVRAPQGKGRGEDSAGNIIDNGRVNYSLDIPADGTYVVNMCAWWPDTSANSFFYAWDSSAPRTLANDNVFGMWHWVTTPPEMLKAGKHTLTIRNRDEGSTFDCLVVAAAGAGSVTTMLDAYYERLAAPHHLRYASLDDWKARRPEVRKLVLRDIGLEPLPEKLPLKITYGGQLDRGDYVVKRVYWQTWPEVYASGYLYLPKTPGKHPAILNPHGHYALGTRDPQEQTRSIAMTRKGYVSLAIDSVHLPAQCFLIGASSIGVMTYNAIRGADLLESLPEVDAARIGCNGMSGGGQQTAYMMTVDDRLVAAAPIVFTSWFRKIMNPAGFPHCICNVVPGILRDVDMPEMTATFAPKPALYECVTGDWEADFPQDEYPELQAVYALYDAKSDIGVQRWVSGHDYNQAMRERAYTFFNQHLKQTDDPAQALEPEIKVETPAALSTMDKPPADARPNETILDWYRARYTFKAADPKDANGWRQFQQELRTQVASLIGDLPVRGKLGAPADSINILGHDGARLQVQSETGIQFQVLLARPKATRASRLVILIHPQGCRGVIEQYEPLMASLLAGQSAVAVAEVRLTGDLKRNWSLDSILWGRPEVGMALTDLRACLDVVAEQPGVSVDHITLIGLGESGVTALFAGALEPRLSAVAAPDLGTTYLEGRTSPPIANVLRIADLPQLIAAIAPRGVLVGNAQRTSYRFAARAYQEAKVETRFEMHNQPLGTAEIAAWALRSQD